MLGLSETCDMDKINHIITVISNRSNVNETYGFLDESRFPNILLSLKRIYCDTIISKSVKLDKARFCYKEINTNISSIRRLRVSKGISLPSDISIHIICGSKDVIHS